MHRIFSSFFAKQTIYSLFFSNMADYVDKYLVIYTVEKNVKI